jgi:hypothetical protein
MAAARTSCVLATNSGDPGFYAPGPSSERNVGVPDVEGRRVVVAQQFPGAPEQTRAQVRRVVQPITSEPRT